MNACSRVVLAFVVPVVAFAACSGPTYVPPVTDNTGGVDAASMPNLDGPQAMPDNRLVFPDLPAAMDVPSKMDQTPSCPFDVCGPPPDTKPGPVCGNSIIEEGENCDDGNSRGGDCCDGVCHKEPFCECPTVGAMCMSTIVCGDSKKDGNEACDDGNAVANDGCAANCLAVEPGWTCAVVGQKCEPVITAACGDSKVDSGENCDDGNKTAGDGCSDTCQIEGQMWTCPVPGKLCIRSEYCGDGRLNGSDQCDDANTVPGDGCTGNCQLENPEIWDCSMEGKKCVSRIVCGDLKVIGDEVCDDGNTAPSDGCSADCKQVDPGWTCPNISKVGGMCTKVPVPICGDAKLAFGEYCDDGNMNNGDGCTSECKVQAGWECPTVGMACKLKEVCGDGRLAPAAHEQCDDGNTKDLDGCSHDCSIEADWKCPEANKPCISTIVCGDGRISKGETCDDRGNKSGDGCDSSCHLESGWTCSGATCKTTCNDGIVAGTESCDDKNNISGDGCSSTCKLESPAPDQRNAWVCPTAGLPCKPTTCGNGIVEGSEQCDDANNESADSCSTYCRKQPVCPTGGGPCKTQCGDGLLIKGIDTDQQCDDGNTIKGDGCDENCKIEPGYSCTPTPVVQDKLVIPIVYHDFKAAWEANGHPDFETFGGSQTGIVGAMLGTDGKPIYAAPNMNVTSGATNFNKWYRDDAINKPVLDVLTLPAIAGGFQYDTNRFFPVDLKGWGNYIGNAQHTPWLDHDDQPRNFHFTSEFRYWFEYRGNEQFDFTGDDDVWVFVNKILTVDIGGVHGPKVGNLALGATNGHAAVCDSVTPNCMARRDINLGLVIGSVYEIVMFQAERHTQGSVYRLTLSNFRAERSVCGPVCGNGVRTPDEECDDGTTNNTGGYGKCNANCTFGPRCGDSKLDSASGEQCDDGVNGAVYGGSAQICGQDCKWAPRCGDAVEDRSFGEACDKGTAMNTGAYGGCSPDCTLGPFCGDGAHTDPEECDPAAVPNPTVTTACSLMCVLKCGNAMPDALEECDDGKAANTGGYGKCTAGCTLGPRCGDGIPNGGEECDDGKNEVSYGKCGPGCKLGPRCGDSVVQTVGGEVCNLGAANSATAYGREKCTNRCRPAPYCGDGALNSEFGEKCDDGAGNTGNPGACKPDCSGRVPNPFCGDAIMQSNEQCDQGKDVNGTAASTCDANCRFKCGNGARNPGEACDLGEALNTGAYGTCNKDCTLAPYCGDNVKNGVEQCNLGMAGNEATPYGPGKCTTACTIAPYCGDGRIDTTFKEECDSAPRCNDLCKNVIFE